MSNGWKIGDEAEEQVTLDLEARMQICTTELANMIAEHGINVMMNTMANVIATSLDHFENAPEALSMFAAQVISQSNSLQDTQGLFIGGKGIDPDGDARDNVKSCIAALISQFGPEAVGAGITDVLAHTIDGVPLPQRAEVIADIVRNILSKAKSVQSDSTDIVVKRKET